MSDGKRFVGRVALVTGAASGIGRATALRLAGEGAAVAVIDRDAEGAEQTASEICASGAKAKAFVCDVGHSERVTEVAAAAERDLGPVDVLANVAGIGDPAAAGRIAEITDERWNMVLAVNLGGPFFFCRALLPGMAERGRGAIVNVSSLAGRSKSATGGLSYSSSKAGLLGLTRHLAFDYGPRGIRVNAICPGGVDTPMLRAGAATASANPDEAGVRMTAYQYFMPIKRLSTPEEQAAAILFLASDDASYINGVALDVNGGLFMA
jgi:3-oxoacyl-[acyl-carrier protein] reductase